MSSFSRGYEVGFLLWSNDHATWVCLLLLFQSTWQRSDGLRLLLFSHLSLVWLFATLWTVASPGSSVHGILQARILEWVAISFSRASSWLRGRTWVSCIAGRLFTSWATGEALDQGTTLAATQLCRCSWNQPQTETATGRVEANGYVYVPIKLYL